jgi:hypothetical protein
MYQLPDQGVTICGMTERTTYTVAAAREPGEVLGYVGIVPPPEAQDRAEIMSQLSLTAANIEDAKIGYVTEVPDEPGQEVVGLIIEFPSSEPRVVGEMQNSVVATIASLGHIAVPLPKIHTLRPGERFMEHVL